MPLVARRTPYLSSYTPTRVILWVLLQHLNCLVKPAIQTSIFYSTNDSLHSPSKPTFSDTMEGRPSAGYALGEPLFYTVAIVISYHMAKPFCNGTTSHAFQLLLNFLVHLLEPSACSHDLLMKR